jgi:hypothetical protein
MKAYGEWKYASTILNFDATWIRVVWFKPCRSTLGAYFRKTSQHPVSWRAMEQFFSCDMRLDKEIRATNYSTHFYNFSLPTWQTRLTICRRVSYRHRDRITGSLSRLPDRMPEVWSESKFTSYVVVPTSERRLAGSLKSCRIIHEHFSTSSVPMRTDQLISSSDEEFLFYSSPVQVVTLLLKTLLHIWLYIAISFGLHALLTLKQKKKLN